MKVLVTDASSAFGSALVDALLANPRVELVAAVGRQRASARCSARLHYFATDIRHPRAVHDLLWGVARDLGITTVVHDVPDAAMTRHLVMACTGHPTISRFVYRSSAEVYAPPSSTTSLIDEEAPLALNRLSRDLRQRVLADVVAGAHNTPSLQVAVLRCAEILAPDVGSQLWDYLQSHVCLRPIGFDPMLNILSLEDAVHAVVAAVMSSATGVFNIPGASTLPLSMAIELSGRADIPVPNVVMRPLYALRRKVTGFAFRYERNVARFHVGGILDGTRARNELGFVAAERARWPSPRWRVLLASLGAERAAAT